MLHITIGDGKMMFGTAPIFIKAPLTLESDKTLEAKK